MSDLFHKFSNNSEFFNEKRVVFQRKGPEPAPRRNTGDVIEDLFGGTVQTPTEKQKQAAAALERARIAENQKLELRNKLLEKMKLRGYEFPGKSKAWNDLCKKLAMEGVRVSTKDEQEAMGEGSFEDKEDQKEREKVAKDNKAEKVKVEISNYFARNQELIDFLSRALAEIHLIQKSNKKGEKDPVCQKECEIVRDTVRNKILEDRTLAKLLPELAPKYEKMPEIRVAGRPKPPREE